MPPRLKQCNQCHQVLPITDFYKHPTNKDRRFGVCKADHCKNVLQRYHSDPVFRARVIRKATQWQKDNPVRAKAGRAAKSANKRARAAGVPGTITTQDVILVWVLSEHECELCGKDLSAMDGDLTLDHVLPMSLGGPNRIENLRTLCRSCNVKENARMRKRMKRLKAA